MVFYMTAVMTIGPQVIWKKKTQPNSQHLPGSGHTGGDKRERAASLVYKHPIYTLIGNYATAGRENFKQAVKVNIKKKNGLDPTNTVFSVHCIMPF